MKNRTKLYIVLLVLFSFPMMLVPRFFIITKQAFIEMRGYGVDSNNRLYIGTENGIFVYKNGVQIKKINPRTSRGYMVTIQPDNCILVSFGSTLYEMDDNGTVLRTDEDYRSREYNRISRMRSFTSVSGDEYSLIKPLGRSVIIKNGKERVWEMSTANWIAKLCTIAGFISAWPLIFLIAFDLRKRRKDQSPQGAYQS